MNPLPGDWQWLAAPMAALALGLCLLVPLGVQVLQRSVVFIDLALAQVAACGALLAALWIDHPNALQAGIAALLAALVGAAAVRSLAVAWPEHREALIGLLYVAAASAAVLMASADAHGRERLNSLLAADVLWAPWPGIALMAFMTAVLCGMGLARRALLGQDAWFYPVFAGALSVSVPVLGLYLVFAMLIGPALWVRRDWPLLGVIPVAACVALGGLALSAGLDLPSGACIALAISAYGFGAVWHDRHPRRNQR